MGIETTPRIMRILKEKMEHVDADLYHTLENFIAPNNIASEEEQLTMEQEIVELANNCFPINPNICLISSKDYKPSTNAGYTYTLSQNIVKKKLNEFSDFMRNEPNFKEFLAKYPIK